MKTYRRPSSTNIESVNPDEQGNSLINNILRGLRGDFNLATGAYQNLVNPIPPSLLNSINQDVVRNKAAEAQQLAAMKLANDASKNQTAMRATSAKGLVPGPLWGDTVYTKDPKTGKLVEGLDSQWLRDSLASTGADAQPLRTAFQQHLATGAASNNMEAGRPATGTASLSNVSRLSSSGSVDKSVIDTIIAEAGGSEAGMRAVAAVIANRAAKTGLSPAQVVKQAGQFEGYSNPGRGSREAQKVTRLRDMAERAFTDISTGKIADPTNGSTSFRTAGTKIHAPHGTVEIAGNVFAKGKPGTALDAINAAAPTPQSKPNALAYVDNGSVTPKLPHISGNLQGLSSAAMNGVGPLPGRAELQPMTPGQDYALPGQTIYNRPDYASLVAPRMGAQVQPPAFRAGATGGVSAGASGNGSSALMPQLPRPRPDAPSAPLISRSVQTVPIDPTTGNPMPAYQQAAYTEAARLRGNSGNSGNSKNSPGSSLVERGTPYPAPPKVTFYAKDKIAQEDAARLGDIIGQMAGNPSPKPAAPRVASIPSSMIERSTPYAPSAPVVPPSPVRVASAAPPYIPGPNSPPKMQERLPQGLQPDMAYGPASVDPASVAAINSNFPPMPRPRPVTPHPPATVPLTSINPPVQITVHGGRVATPHPIAPAVIRQPPSFLDNLSAAFNTTPAGHIVQMVQGKPVTGGLFSLFQGSPIQAAHLVAGPAIPRPPAPVAPAFAPDSPGGQFEKDHGIGSATTSMQNSTRWQTGY